MSPGELPKNCAPRRCWLPLLLVALVACASLSASPVPLSAAEAEKAVEDGRKAFDKGRYVPWYNAEQDSLQPVRLPAPPPSFKWPSFSLSWLQWLAWGTLAAILCVLVILLVRFGLVARSKRKPRKTASPALQEPERVEALPFMADRARGDYLAEARRQYEAGNYGEAIIYLFSYELIELDKSAIIHLARGKTNRQYLRETGRVQPLARLLEGTIVTFEDVFFGQRPLDRQGFEACWNRLDEFSSLIARAAT